MYLKKLNYLRKLLAKSVFDKSKHNTRINVYLEADSRQADLH